MGKKYFLLRVLDACRIVLADKRGFGKDEVFYNQLRTGLEEDWAQRHSVALEDKKTEFEVGEHVLAKSTNCKGPTRAIVLELNGCTTSLQERSYSLFLYDEGEFEDLDESKITALKNVRKEQVEPRSLVVRIPGIAPAKIVPDLATMSLSKDGNGATKPDVILTQDSSWSNRSNQLVKQWLQDETIKYLRVETAKTNIDGSIYGDICRRLRTKKSKDLPETNKSDLGQYILDTNIGLFNEQLAKSQLKTRTSPPPKRIIFNDKFDEDKLVDTSVDLFALLKKGSKPPVREKTQLPVEPTATNAIEPIASGGCSTSPVSSSNNEAPDQATGNLQYCGSDTPSSTSASVLDQNQLDMMLFSNKEHDNDIPGRLLVRGKFMKKPYTNSEQFQLPKNIVKALEVLKIGHLSNMHKVVAPNLIRGLDQIVIAPDGASQQGRNMRALSYLLPLLGMVYHTYENMATVDESQPPETLIIVNSYNTGTDLETFINQLLNFSRNIPMRVKFLHKDCHVEPHKRSHYYRKMVPGGMSILIMTMPYLAAVMDTNEGPFLFNKLRYLIYEEADLYLKYYKEEIHTFINAASENLLCSYDSFPFQIVFSGSKWSVEMENLYKEMRKDRTPMVTISAPNQVLRYAKIQWNVHYIKEEEERLQNLSDLLKTKCLEVHTRIVIACSDPIIAKSVYDSLNCLGGAQIILVNSKSNINELQDIRDRWEKKSTNVLVVSDDRMQDVAITDATCLICFDSPKFQIHSTVNRSFASGRFRYLWANIRHIEMEQPSHYFLSSDCNTPSPVYTEVVIPPEKPKTLIAHFLMTGEEHNFYQLYKFVSSLGGIHEFAPELQLLADTMDKKGQQSGALCTGFKLYGFCNHTDPKSCHARHFFSESELSVTPIAPFTGEVEVRIVRCENPSSYQAKLLRHFVFENGKRICNKSYINEARWREEELTKYYGEGETNVDKTKHLKSVEEGACCAVKVVDSDDAVYYMRANIEKILQNDKLNNPMTVRVYCIDSGVILNPAVDQLYELPKQFQEWTPLVVNLILCNLKPGRDEKEYRQSTVKKAKEKDFAKDKIFNAKIWLSIGNTIWVNPMVEYHLDSTTKRPCRGDSVRRTLISEEIAVFNAEHLDVLREAVNKYPGVYKGITSTKSLIDSSSDELLMVKQEFHQIGDEIRWAFVEKSQENKFCLEKIVTQFGYHPWLFFGIHDKYYEHLNVLEKELSECIEKHINGTGEDQRFVNFKDKFQNYYEVGMAVAAKSRVDQTWMRGLIIQIHDVQYEDEADKKNKVEYEIFLVDFGDTCYMTVDELFPIPHKFVDRLPFQAIAFKLDHVRPTAGGEIWTKDEKDAFLDVILLDEKSINVELVVYDDIDQDELIDPIPCRYYNTVAFYRENDLGSLLVQKGAAEWKPGKEDMVKTASANLLNFYNASVEQALTHIDEDEEQGPFESNEFDMSDFDFYVEGSVIQKMRGLKKNGSKFPDTSIDHPANENRNTIRTQATDVVPSSTSSASSSRSTVPKPIVRKTPLPESKTEPLPPKDGLLHPKVLWRQTNTSFILTIQLPDIKEYILSVMTDSTTVEFKTLDKSPNYAFKIRVYGKIRSDYSAALSGQYLRVVFVKKMEAMWPRSLFCKTEKYKWLVWDLDYLEDEDDGDMSNDKDEIRQQGTVQEAIPEEEGNCDNGIEELYVNSDDEDGFLGAGEDDDTDED